MKKKLTIIIPTHYRHHYLSRVLKYYEDVDYPVLIADSSAQKFIEPLAPHVSYYHYPDMKINEKFLKILSKVETDYLLFCADDDFWVKESIQECIEFLEVNKDYSSVQGKYIGFEIKTKNKINFIPSYLHAESIEDQSIAKRLNMSMNNYMPLFYAMHRSHVFKKVFSDHFSTGVNHAILNEISLNLYSLIYGKHKVLDILTYVRDNESLPTPVQRDNLKDISIKEEFKDEFKQFKTNITCLIGDIDNSLNGEQIISDALSMYINKITFKNNTKSNRLKSALKKYFYILKPMYNYFIKQKNIKNLFANTQSIKGYPHSDIQSEKSWLEISMLIKKYNIKE